MGPPLGVAWPGPLPGPLPSPLPGELGAVGPAVLGVVGFALPVGVVVGAGESLDDPVEGVLGVEAEGDGVEGIELGEELPGPDGVVEGESGFCDGVVPCVRLPPGFSWAGRLSEPLPWPGSFVKTLLW